MADRRNPLAADFADQIAAHQRARKAGGSGRTAAEPVSDGPTRARPPRPPRSRLAGRAGSVATPPPADGWGGRRAQKDFLVPAVVAEQVEAVGVRWADLIETAWWRHRPSVATGLERSATAGEVRVRPSLLVDVHAEIKAAAAERGWSASQLVTALVIRELDDRT